MVTGLLSRVPRWAIIGVLVVATGLAGYFIWHRISPRESTDDAQVTGHVSPVATQVGGTVKGLRVQDNQTVHAGDVLVEIDPRDYEIAFAKAQADLAVAEAMARAARSDVPVTTTSARSEQNVANAGSGNAEIAVQSADREIEASQAKVESARARLQEVTANATRASQDLARLKPLVEKDEISKQQFDAATSTAQAAQAAVQSAESAVREAQANLAVSQARRQQASGALEQAKAQAKAASTVPQQIALTEAQAAGADARVLQARAAVEQAKLNLDRTTVRATADGIVSRRSVEEGQVVQAGQPLMSLTALNDVWVTANFKETQLDRMKPGQTAAVEVDAYGGREFQGRVDSIAAATGATFSLLPPDNATGNFVKVVQRIPVKILLDAKQDGTALLRPGMSVNATVYLK